VLTGEGTLALIEDPLRIYAYLRVVERGLSRDTLPVTNAEVTLYELDDPPPLGDDVIDPSGYTEITTPRFQITEETLYNPRADEVLGTATTGDDGRATFVVISDMIGGSATTTRAIENFHTGQTSVTITDRLVGEALPDLAVSVRSADGTLLAGTRLIALNVEHRRLGRFDQPVDVVVEPRAIDPHPGPPPPATTATVPDVLELGKRVAVAQIAAAGLTVETHGSDGPNAWVRSQRPDGGAVVPIGSAVTLTLSTQPRP
jgi:PASTA domain-containing protein